MIPADVLNSLKALALTQKPLITATSPVSAAAAFEPGQKLQASVQAQLAPGIFKVQIAGQTLQLQLPSTIRTGDTITLQVVSLLPRLTFTMAASANPLSTADQLSSTARLLSSLTQQPLQKEFVRPINSAPLWTGALLSPDTPELAGKLHTALSQSGLFYEAHQAQWLAGTRHTTLLMQEPQNLPADKVKAAFMLQDKPAAQLEKAAQMQSGTAPSSLAEAASTAANQPRPTIQGIPDHLQQLVQQQLQALETRQVQWQGQVWQNQEMTWKIQEEDAHYPNGTTGKQWSTQIHLDLPNLGVVTAKLSFGINGVSLALDAGSNETREKLGAASSALVSALSERGISTASTLVAKHDDTR